MTHTRRILVGLVALTFACSCTVHGQRTTLTESDHAAMKASGALDGGSDFAVAPGRVSGRVSPLHPAGAPKGSGAGCDCWIDPDATYTLAMQPNDDGSSAQIPIPFIFNLYGDLYSSLWINNNGNVTFDNQFGGFTSSGFPVQPYPMVAPFWADVDTRPVGGGEVWYKVTPTAVFVNWVGVGYYSMQTNLLNTFQLIITDGNDPVIGIGKNVSFCYKDMQWTTGGASSGVGGFGGTAANVGANRGNGVDYIQFTRPDQPGAFYDGPFLLNDGIDWLDYKQFVFTTDVFTANIPPIGSGTTLCDTVTTCVGQTAQLDMTFLSPEPNQITTGFSTALTLSNYMEIINTSGANSIQIVGEFTPTALEIGFHTVTFEATDNGAPPLTAVYNLVVQVLPVGITIAPTAISTCTAAPPIDLFTLFTGNPPLGGIWQDPNGNPWSGILDPAVDISGTYSYILGNGSPCPTVGMVTVTISTVPDPGTPGAGTYCADNALVDLFTLLGGTPQSGGTWTDPNNMVHSNLVDPAIDPSGIYTYSINGILPCPSASTTVTITINQPVDAGLNASLALCRADALIDLHGVLGGTPDVGGAWVDPNLVAFTNPLDPAIALPGVYTYTMVGAAPCPTKSSDVTITFDPEPDAGTGVAFDICADGQATVLFNLLGGTPDVGGAWLSPTMSTHSGVLLPPVDQNGVYRYVAYGIGACNALTDTSEVDVFVNLLPIVQFGAVPMAGCAPLDVEFTNNTDPVYNAISDWDMGDGGLGSNLVSQPYTYNTPGTYTVSLTVTSDSGCVSNFTHTNMILVEPAPLAEFTTYPNPAPVSNSAVLLTATDPYASDFQWTITEQATGEVLGTSEDRELLFDFPSDLGGLYDVCLIVQDIYGCTDTTCKVVEIRDPLLVFVPNTFTPDGDGVNDLFFPSIVGSDPDQYELIVFDRWGGSVFQSTDQQQAWDGKHRNGGEVLAQGIYTWKLKTAPENDGGRKEYRGHVTLIK
ncbi:MAG: gliding motility-associated C-terminal domain-containing protein [Flavobacteriales bacterium]|nr:gliding motility-associated C-terminal domain-containing protein [Flavobacteriales bacterium]